MEVKHLGMNWLKNTTAGGAQSTVIKNALHNTVVLCSVTQNKGRMWGSCSRDHLLTLLKKNNGIYEIITDFPHKVYFDIDENPLDLTQADFIQEAKQKILTHFPNAEMAISGSKDSLHIVLSNYTIANETERDMMKELCKELKMDWKVYTKNRLMKCIHQSKTDGRVQEIIENKDWKSHVITAFLGHSLPFPTLSEEVVAKVNKFDMSILPKYVLTTDIEWDTMTNLDILHLLPCGKEFSHTYTSQVARFCYTQKLSFEQFYQWISVKHNDADYLAKWQSHWNKLHKFPPVSDCKMKQVLAYYYPALKKDRHYKAFLKTFLIGQTTPIETITPAEFLVTDKFLIFNTGMGSGKTAQTSAYLKELDYCWIAPNRALAKNTELRLNGVSHYLNFSSQDKKAGILDTCNQLICVLNSIHYLSRKFKVVVIDEIETVLDKFHTDFMDKNKKQIWNAFLRLIRDADRVILLDAFITTKTTKFLEMLEAKPIIYVRKFEPQTRTVQYLKDYESMILDILEKLRNGSKVFIFYPYKKSSQNYSSMDQLFNYIQQATGKTGIYYNADVDDDLKTNLMKVNEVWKQFDFVLTNNVITCGVNYENLDFDYKYIFIGTFNSPRDMIQVSYRCRHLSTGIIKCCYLKGIPPTGFTRDTDVMQCPIYTQLYNSSLVEKMSPLRRSFQEFCKRAHYKQDTSDEIFSDALKQDVIEKLQTTGIQFPFHKIEDLTLSQAEEMKQKAMRQEATMLDKVQLSKYYYVKSILQEHHSHAFMSAIWDCYDIEFMKQIGLCLSNPNSVFHKISKLNDWDLFPRYEPLEHIKSVKLNDEILDQIFTEFKFKFISRTSYPLKILTAVYNLYFKSVVISTFTNEQKHTSYFIGCNCLPEKLEWIKVAYIIRDDFGTFTKVIKEGDDDLDDFVEV